MSSNFKLQNKWFEPTKRLRLYWQSYHKGKLINIIELLIKTSANPNATASYKDGRTEGNIPFCLLFMQYESAGS